MEESNDVLLEAVLALVDGVVDYRGQPAIRSKSGYWRSAWLIIGRYFLTNTQFLISLQHRDSPFLKWTISLLQSFQFLNMFMFFLLLVFIFKFNEN
jgi:hypothetical protein